jgi:hypothetical protein
VLSNVLHALPMKLSVAPSASRFVDPLDDATRSDLRGPE